MLELTGEHFTANLKVWFGDVEAETMYRQVIIYVGNFFVIVWCVDFVKKEVATCCFCQTTALQCMYIVM